MIQREHFYRTRKGEKIGPMKKTAGGFIGYFPDRAFPEIGFNYHPDGRRAALNRTDQDIVARWVEPDSAPDDVEGGWISFGFSFNGVGLAFGDHSFHTEKLCREFLSKNALLIVQFSYVDGELIIKQQVPA